MEKAVLHLFFVLILLFMPFFNCEPTEVCTAPWHLRPNPSAEVLLCHSNRMNLSLQKRLQCVAASGCWVSALLSWETMKFMWRSIEGTLLQALGYAARQCCGDSNPWSWGCRGRRSLSTAASDKHCTATLGSENCFILLHVALLQGQVSLFFRI